MAQTYKKYRESDPTNDPRIAEAFADGEELVWAGRPVVWLRLRKSALPWLVGVLLTVVGVLFVKRFVGAPIGGTDVGIHPDLDVVVRTVFGIVASLVGLFGIGLLLYPLIEYRESKRELFVLTSQRCIVWSRADGDFGVKELKPSQLKDMYREVDSQGRGNLMFGPDPGLEFGEDEAEESRYEIGFHGIENVREVERLIRDTLITEFDVPREKRY